ncbi:iron-containing alcohol dehydrogenase [Salisediminibacterium beveridgei]|uniref:Alcohol dehydrogenase n=1 Tax=Salisediminibacterium beveridgei TaxID=632773 RepID=A0A1D7QYF2_9BACI|nr:iron-containing alcohol dehydrogenase [Salisediminibacterium beveridgei]AOM84008.1 Alcohol dehydrogenase [Salisediminibacterium beveridgei]
MIYEAACRTVQYSLKTVSPVMPWREPELMIGENALDQLPRRVAQEGITKVLVVTDEGIMTTGMVERLCSGLSVHNVASRIFSGTVPNPTITNVEEARDAYVNGGCEGIIAIGGGSPIDCAKAVGARVAWPKRSIPSMKGLLKIWKSTPFTAVVPTTAGTGSEATIASVISNPETHEKYALMDYALLPDVAVLDPLLTTGLPGSITAMTGMDALTHAVEAHLNRGVPDEVRATALEAIDLIFNYLPVAYEDGGNVFARKQMQYAAYLAGNAFTKAYVGYVHALAHPLSGYYNVPHGLANAIILPHVLRYYGTHAESRLAEISNFTGLMDESATDREKAKAVIRHIEKLKQAMAIPVSTSVIQDQDLPDMVKRAVAEANPLYPVPVILREKELTELYNLIRA